MKIKKRTYNTRLVKRDYPYSIQEISELFDIHKKTVHNWIKAGLRLIDTSRPYLIHGSDLKEFLNKKQTTRKCRCKPHELYCLKCRGPRQSKNGAIEIKVTSPKLLQLQGKCSSCDTKLFKAGSISKLLDYAKIFEIQKVQALHIIERTHPTLIYHFERMINQ